MLFSCTWSNISRILSSACLFKCEFKDCPGFLNSTGRLGPKRGRKCYITPAFSGVPNKGGQNQNSKPPLRVTMMPRGAPSISKYGSLVRPDAQIVSLRALRLRRPPCV